jgi:AcrR family transcriptional regulator
MSPRAYNLGLRLAAAEQTRSRIIAAAREILSDEDFDGLSIDAISRRAGVARMTVYYQFVSRRGLLEALYDDLAARGLIESLPLVNEDPDPKRALDSLIAIFMRFWANDRLIIRRLRGLAVIDQEIEAGLRERDRMRCNHVEDVLRRIEAAYGWHSTMSIEEATKLVGAYINFENYDQLAGEDSSSDATIELLQRSLKQMLNL